MTDHPARTPPGPPRPTQAAAPKLAARRRLALAAALAAAIASLPGIYLLGQPDGADAIGLHLFLHPDHPDFIAMQRINRQFSSSELAVIGIRFHQPIGSTDQTADQIRLLAKVEQDMAHALPGASTLSLASIPYTGAWAALPAWQILRKALAAERPPTLLEQARSGLSPEARSALQHRLQTDDLLRHRLITHDARLAVVAAQLAPGSTLTGRAAIVQRIEEQTRRLRDNPLIAEAHAAGPLVTQTQLHRHMLRDQRIFGTLIALGAPALLLGVLRSIRWTIAALLAAGTAVTATLGLAWATGTPTVLNGMMCVTLVTICTLAIAVQFSLQHRRNARRARLTPQAHPRYVRLLNAIRRRTFREKALPAAFVALTTAAGFAAMLISQTRAISDFAWLAAAGTLIGCLAALAGAWVCMSLPPRARSPGRKQPLPPPLRTACCADILPRLARFAIRQRIPLGIGTLALLVACGLLAGGLRVQSSFIENFRPVSPTRQAFEFFEQAGIALGPTDFIITSTDPAALLTPQAQQALLELQARYCQPDRPTAFTTITSIANLWNALPDTLRQRPGLLASLIPVLFQSEQTRPAVQAFVYLPPTGNAALQRNQPSQPSQPNQPASLRLLAMGSDWIPPRDKVNLAMQFADELQQTIGPDHSVEVSGLFVVYARLLDNLVQAGIHSFLLAVAMVSLLMTALLCSIRLAAACVLVNLIPAAACVGLAGAMQSPVNMSTLLVLGVSFGICIDASIYYVWQFRSLLRKGRSAQHAVQACAGQSAHASLLSQLVIVLGFGMLGLSDFVPTATFGLLLAATILLSAAGLLLLLAPLVLLLCTHQPPATPAHGPREGNSPIHQP